MKKHCQNIIELLDEEQNLIDKFKGQEPSETDSNRLEEIKKSISANIGLLTDHNNSLRG